MSRPQEKGAQRIISLGSVITEEISLLSSSDKLVGDTIYCERPPAAKFKEKVGNILEVNLEKIISLKPDVVLATELTDPRAKQKLRVREELLRQQAESIGIALHKLMVPEMPTMEVYNDLMEQALKAFKREGIDYSVFGDIFLCRPCSG